MDIVKRETLEITPARGRILQKVCGKTGAALQDGKMTAIFARFAPHYGKMETHYHETEYMYVIDAKDAVVSYGDSLNDRGRKNTIKKGDILRPHDGEWHRFDFSSEEGFVDFLNFFAVPEAHVVTDKSELGL